MAYGHPVVQSNSTPFFLYRILFFPQKEKNCGEGVETSFNYLKNKNLKVFYKTKII